MGGHSSWVRGNLQSFLSNHCRDALEQGTLYCGRRSGWSRPAADAQEANLPLDVKV